MKIVKSCKPQDAGRIISILSFLENLLKFAAMVCFFIWPIDVRHEKECSKIARGNSRHGNSVFIRSQQQNMCFSFSETVYLDLLGVLSAVGILTSIFLIFGVVKRKSGLMIWWICSQGITIVYQILITVDFAFGCCKFKKFTNFWVVGGALSVIFLILLQVYFMVFITKLYQDIVYQKANLGRRKSRKYDLESSAITPIDLLHI
jgi:Domain of unknown function (DUF4728)